jgi:hypothetical protein
MGALWLFETRFLFGAVMLFDKLHFVTKFQFRREAYGVTAVVHVASYVEAGPRIIRYLAADTG